jgi:hypothetical protein
MSLYGIDGYANGGRAMISLAELLKRHYEDSAWEREWCIAEEDMPQTMLWRRRYGTYSRFFRSHNVVPLELARKLRDQMRQTGDAPRGPGNAA